MNEPAANDDNLQSIDQLDRVHRVHRSVQREERKLRSRGTEVVQEGCVQDLLQSSSSVETSKSQQVV